jgi:hypothetical protein
VLRQVREAKASGKTAEQTASGLDTAKLGGMVGATGADGVAQFKAYFLDVYVAGAYRELDGPLGDLPDGLR